MRCRCHERFSVASKRFRSDGEKEGSSFGRCFAAAVVVVGGTCLSLNNNLPSCNGNGWLDVGLMDGIERKDVHAGSQVLEYSLPTYSLAVSHVTFLKKKL